jgi:hypothetical protein
MILVYEAPFCHENRRLASRTCGKSDFLVEISYSFLLQPEGESTWTVHSHAHAKLAGRKTASASRTGNGAAMPAWEILTVRKNRKNRHVQGASS